MLLRKMTRLPGSPAPAYEAGPREACRRSTVDSNQGRPTREAIALLPETTSRRTDGDSEGVGRVAETNSILLVMGDCGRGLDLINGCSRKTTPELCRVNNPGSLKADGAYRFANKGGFRCALANNQGLALPLWQRGAVRSGRTINRRGGTMVTVQLHSPRPDPTCFVSWPKTLTFTT